MSKTTKTNKKNRTPQFDNGEIIVSRDYRSAYIAMADGSIRRLDPDQEVMYIDKAKRARFNLARKMAIESLIDDVVMESVSSTTEQSTETKPIILDQFGKPF